MTESWIGSATWEFGFTWRMWKFVVYVETLGSQWSSPTKSHRFEPRPFISRPKENRDDKINAAHIKHERNFRSTVFRRNKFREISVFALAKSRKTNFADSAQWARLAKFRRNECNQRNKEMFSPILGPYFGEIWQCFRYILAKTVLVEILLITLITAKPLRGTWYL